MIEPETNMPATPAGTVAVPMPMADRDAALAELARKFGPLVDRVRHDGAALHCPPEMAAHLEGLTGADLALRHARAIARQALNEERERRLALPFEHALGRFDQRPHDLANWAGLNGLVGNMIASGQGTDPVVLRTADNETVSAPATEVAAMLHAMHVARGAIMAAAWAAKDAIDAAADEAAIEAILATAWA